MGCISNTVLVTWSWYRARLVIYHGSFGISMSQFLSTAPRTLPSRNLRPTIDRWTYISVMVGTTSAAALRREDCPVKAPRAWASGLSASRILFRAGSLGAHGIGPVTTLTNPARVCSHSGMTYSARPTYSGSSDSFALDCCSASLDSASSSSGMTTLLR